MPSYEIQADIFTRLSVFDSRKGSSNTFKTHKNISLYFKRKYLIIYNYHQFLMLKGQVRSKNKSAQMKEREKCKTTSHHWPQCANWFSRYRILKSGIWARWTSPFCRFLASFSLENDVIDAVLQNNEKMKVQYLRSLLIDLLEILQAFRT